MLCEVFVSYRKWKDGNGYLRKEWRNELHFLHREDGPAYICYYTDGTIMWEEFYLNGKNHRYSGPAQISYNRDGSIEWKSFYIKGKHLGDEEKGFWALWERLDEEGRQDPDILKCLARYS
jgi:hypothetical protein